MRRWVHNVVLRKKSLYFASYKKDVPWLEKEFKARKAAGFPVRWMESEEIEKRYGITNTHGAILSDQGASIDAFQLAHDILHYNNGKGLEIYDKTQIQDITYKESAVRVTTNYGDTIKAKKIIYCTGFESTEIIKDKFVQLLSTYAIVGEKQHKKSVLEDLLVWNTADPYLYMRTTDDNRLLIGGEDEDFVDAQKRDGMLAKKVRNLKRLLPSIFLNPQCVLIFHGPARLARPKTDFLILGFILTFQEPILYWDSEETVLLSR